MLGTTCGKRPTPRRRKGPCPVRRVWACISPGCPPARKAPWALRIVLPVAGEGEKRSSRPNGRRKRAGRPRWARKRCASTRKRWTLQPAHPRARDRRCSGDADRGINQPSSRPSQVDVIAGCLCGESRSGPDPWTPGRRDDRKVEVTSLVTVSGEASTSLGMACQPGSKVIRVVLVDRVGCKPGALGRGSAPPLTGRRADAVLVLPLAGSATEGVRGRVTTRPPGR
jgi:hypothetical protein